MNNDWRYSIQYCMPRTDAVFNKLPISKVKYEIYKYLKNPVNTIIKNAINDAKNKIEIDKKDCSCISGCRSYKRFVSVIHEEREKKEKSEWRYMDKELYDKLKEKMIYSKDLDETKRIVTFKEFVNIIEKLQFVSDEFLQELHEIWDSATPVKKRDPVHEIYWKISIFDEVQKKTRSLSSDTLFEPHGRRNRVYSYLPLKKNNFYEEIYWYSQHDNYSCGFIQYHSKSSMGKRNTSVRKIKYEENRRVMPCRKYHSITDLYKICKNFGINVSDIDLKTTSKNALMQKIYPNLRFI